MAVKTHSTQKISSRNFNSTNIISPALVIGANYLVVAGGGAGGMTPTTGYSSGGGAGGLLYDTNASFILGTVYTVTIGGGGTAAIYPGTLNTSGSNSSILGTGFTTVTAIGGGTGPTSTAGGIGANGGSGGGGNRGNLGGFGVYPNSSYLNQPRQGYDGGASDVISSGGGGGGAGGAGANSSSNSNGGIGLQLSISGTSTYYAGGGGGGISGSGGAGGGGSVSSGLINGVVNLGGGGAASPGAGTVSGAGGSGIVIIRSAVPASATTGSPMITTDGSFKVYKFTSSGTITF